MESHTQLLNRIRACTICADHLPEGPRPVLQIHPNAKILITGQAPGRKVHKSGIPFDDMSGIRLRDWLGVTPEQFYDPEQFAILPMGFCYPGTGKSGDLPPRPECAPAWHDVLLAELQQIEFTVVLGKYAQASHFGNSKKTLTELVQSWRDYWPQAIPLPHPSPRNNLWLQRNPWFESEVLPELRQHVSKVLKP
ncbi:MAG: uracil-DNA glycosylase family protein [Calditrichaeota bacterium]|nr:MAG: uracil-DNA glycosylase family protein [Calditrichota bacterium]